MPLGRPVLVKSHTILYPLLATKEFKLLKLLIWERPPLFVIEFLVLVMIRLRHLFLENDFF